MALNEEVNQLKLKNGSFKFLEKMFTKENKSKMSSSSLVNMSENDNYLIRSLENIVVFRREKVKDKENEDSCKLLAEWLIEYTKYLITMKFKNRYEPVLDFNEFSDSRIELIYLCDFRNYPRGLFTLLFLHEFHDSHVEL